VIPPAPPPVPKIADFNAAPQRSAIALGIMATLILAGGSLAILIYHSMSSPEPNRVLIIQADRDWQDVDLILEGGDLKEPRIGTLDRLGSYIMPFFVWPGQYTLHVRSQGAIVYSKKFDLTSNLRQEFDLRTSGATTRPAPATAETK
jgi:hypothetical protein